MAAQLAFTAIFSGDEAVLARAVAGLPGLAIDRHLGAFATWTQANECARRLNEGLGLKPSESRSIVTDAMLAAQKLICECQALRQKSTQLLQGAGTKRVHSEFLLAELDLGLTLCESAFACSPTAEQLEYLLRNARRALSTAKSAIGKFDFPSEHRSQIADGIERLQFALEESAPKESPAF
jgi:hypothetical protein